MNTMMPLTGLGWVTGGSTHLCYVTPNQFHYVINQDLLDHSLTSGVCDFTCSVSISEYGII